MRSARTSDAVVQTILAAGGTAASAEGDLSDTAVPAQLFDRAESTFGPVEILVDNASGWLADRFAVTSMRKDRFGRVLRPVDAQSHDQQFAVDAPRPLC